ncbi:MAG: PIN domain-containing protein [Nitrospirae bacterium]|nr:PIN domain-containing protein [Nitrospirota bacterium]
MKKLRSRFTVKPAYRNRSSFLTDTHALLWHFTNSNRISTKAKDIFDKCEEGHCVIFIPSIVIAECLRIFNRKKIAFNFITLFDQIRESENYAIIPLDQRVLLQMTETTEVTELHDKIIVATAQLLDVQLITKDSFLRKLKNIKTIW